MVSGLVRRDDQRAELSALGADVRVGELANLTAESLAPMLSGFDAIVYAAGSNGGAREVTAAIDGEGVVSALEASRLAGESDLDWLILRPSMLVDRAGLGTISLGPAQPHDEIAREDVAATLAELLHEPRIRRKILELDQGSTPIASAVQANVRE